MEKSNKVNNQWIPARITLLRVDSARASPFCAKRMVQALVEITE